MRSPLVIGGVLRLAVAKVAAGWRPLLWFWLSVLVTIAAGAAVLHYLGPPAGQPARDEVRRQQPSSPPPPPARPAATESPAVASTSAAMLPPRWLSRDEPSPPRSQPAPPPPPSSSPDAQGTSGTEQEGSKPPDQAPLIVLHPASAESGKAMAEQLAAQSGIASDQITVGTAAGTLPRAAVIRFYSAEDHALARRLGNGLAQMGYSWRIENLAERPSTAGRQPLEIWLPARRSRADVVPVPGTD